MSVLLIRWIIVLGPELRIGINNFAFQNYALNMGVWELDHAAFGFALGAPPMFLTITLKAFKRLTLLNLTTYTFSFYLLQALGTLILCYLFVDIHVQDSSLIPYSFLDTPSYWFWNFALIASALFAFLILLSTLLYRWIVSRNQHSLPIDR